MKGRMRTGGLLVLVAVLLGVALLAVGSQGVDAQSRERIKWAIVDKLTVLEGTANFNSDVTMNDDLSLVGDLAVDDVSAGGAIAATSGITVGTNLYLDDGVWNGIQDGNVVFGDSSDAQIMWFEDAVNGDSLYVNSDEGIYLVTAQATDTVKIDTGNLVVGDGTPGETQDGEDAYVEGMLEVDGAAYLDGALDVAGNISSDTGAITITDNVDITGTVNYGANDLYPVGYASSGQKMVYGTASVTGTLVAPHGLTTVTFCLATLGEDPTAGAGEAAHVTVVVAANVCTLKVWQDDFVTAATEANVDVQWMVVGAP